jgi:hypothetical protein
MTDLGIEISRMKIGDFKKEAKVNVSSGVSVRATSKRKKLWFRTKTVQKLGPATARVRRMLMSAA